MFRLPFSVLLPLIALSVWVAVVAVPLTPLYLQLREEAKTAKDTTVNEGNFQYTVSRDQYVSYHLDEAMKSRADWMTAIDLPGMVGEVISSAFTTWPESWHPQAIELETWRVYIFTFYCLPFWWFAGRGMDALRGRRLHWIALLAGTLLAAWCLVMLFGLAAVKPADPNEGGAWILWGSGLWAALYLPMPVAWVRQWRRARAERSADVIPLSS